MTKKNLLILLMIIFIPLCCFAQKEGKLKFGTYGSYKGMVANNKPMGKGVLTYKWKESTFAVKMIDKISGKFYENIVNDATISFAARKCTYEGKLKYDIVENGKLAITLLEGKLNLDGQEYLVFNEVYQSDGEKSTCTFGTGDSSGLYGYVKTEDFEIKESIFTINGKQLINNRLEIPVQLKSFVFLKTSVSVDRYDGCQLNIHDKVIGYKDDVIIPIRFKDNICIYNADKNLSISFIGKLQKFRNEYNLYNLESVGFVRQFNDGTVMNGERENINIIKQQGEDTDYSSDILFIGEINYGNGDKYKGKFILDSKGYNSFDDFLKKVSFENLTLGSGVLTKANGEEIITKSIQEKRRDYLLNEVHKCDSIWSLTLNKSDKSFIKNHLENKTFSYSKNVVDNNYRFTINVNFTSNNNVKIKAKLIPLTTKAIPSSKPELGTLISMFSSISETIDYDGEYSLIDGVVYLRRDGKPFFKMAAGNRVPNTKDIYLAEQSLEKEKEKLQKITIGDDSLTLITNHPIAFISGKQIYTIEK